MVATEHRGRGVEIAPSERLADRRRRHRLAVAGRGHQAEGLDLEAVDGSHRAEQLDVAAPLVPEVEVLADDDTPRVQALDEHLLDEVFRRFGGAALVEREHHRVVDARRLDARQALVEIGEEHRSGFGSHDRRRMTIERHNCGARAELGRPQLHLGDHGTVT